MDSVFWGVCFVGQSHVLAFNRRSTVDDLFGWRRIQPWAWPTGMWWHLIYLTESKKCHELILVWWMEMMGKWRTLHNTHKQLLNKVNSILMSLGSYATHCKQTKPKICCCNADKKFSSHLAVQDCVHRIMLSLILFLAFSKEDIHIFTSLCSGSRWLRRSSSVSHSAVC